MRTATRGIAKDKRLKVGNGLDVIRGGRSESSDRWSVDLGPSELVALRQDVSKLRQLVSSSAVPISTAICQKARLLGSEPVHSRADLGCERVASAPDG